MAIEWNARLDGTLVEGTLQLRKGTTHTLTFRSAPLVGQQISLDSMGLYFDPTRVQPPFLSLRTLPTDGSNWTINTSSAEPGDFVLAFKSPRLDTPIQLKGNVR
uniref:hypothetical protein n=1 Tax=Bacillus mobilis TaxID=2026190 RepID=UPI00371A3267